MAFELLALAFARLAFSLFSPRSIRGSIDLVEAEEQPIPVHMASGCSAARAASGWLAGVKFESIYLFVPQPLTLTHTTGQPPGHAI